MGGHLFWLGVLIGSVLAMIAPRWIGVLLAVVSAGVLGGFHLIGEHHASGAAVPWVLVAVGGIGIGLYFGRIRGLRHLGEAEFRTRLRNIRTVSRF